MTRHGGRVPVAAAGASRAVAGHGRRPPLLAGARRALAGAGLVACALLGCAQSFPVTAPSSEAEVRAKVAADVFTSWTPDGSEILYHRQFADRERPAGIYAIAPDGTRQRFLAPAGFLFPTRPRLSPSGRYLLLDDLSRILVVDLTSGRTERVLYTDNLVFTADWSPDGRSIVYGRLSRAFGEPIDSAGIHILDPITGRHRMVGPPGSPLIGGRIRWSPDGGTIAYVYGSPPALYVADTNGTNARRLYAVPTNQFSIDNVQWVTPVPGGEPTLLIGIRKTGVPTEGAFTTVLIHPVTARGETLGVELRQWDSFRNDLRYLAYVRPTRADSVPVLHVRSVSGDVPFVDMPLTRYVRP